MEPRGAMHQTLTQILREASHMSMRRPRKDIIVTGIDRATSGAFHVTMLTKIHSFISTAFA